MPGPTFQVAARYEVLGERRPLITEALYFGEMARRYAQGIYGRLSGGGASPLFSGRLPDGTAITGHRHAFFLPADEDVDGCIDHLTVYCRGASAGDGTPLGFDTSDVLALQQFERMLTLDGKVAVQLRLLGLYSPGSFPECGALASSASWISATPFVPSRMERRSGRNRETPFDQLLVELGRLGFPAPTDIRMIQDPVWSSFELRRALGEGKRGFNRGFGFRLEFAEPVTGPMALGYGSHFGLGQFTAIRPRVWAASHYARAMASQQREVVSDPTGCGQHSIRARVL